MTAPTPATAAMRALRARAKSSSSSRYNPPHSIHGSNTGRSTRPVRDQSALGAGGMGEVFRARDTRLDRPVAIKVLAAGLAANPDFRERFEREARAVSSLDHPNICALYDVGREQPGRGDGMAVDFLVMQFVAGETLATRVARGPLKIREVLRLASEIASALDKAHRSGIVHRDLKPGNIMMTTSGAKLLDFGLARVMTPSTAAAAVSMPTVELTAEGTILGTFQSWRPSSSRAEKRMRAPICSPSARSSTKRPPGARRLRGRAAPA